MEEVYRLTWKEWIPIINYWTYSARQKPKEERSEKEKSAINSVRVGLTLYNAIILIPTVATIATLEKLIE